MEKLYIIDCISESDLENIGSYIWWKWSKNDQLEWKEYYRSANSSYKAAIARKGDALIQIDTSSSEDEDEIKSILSSVTLYAPKDGLYVIDNFFSQREYTEDYWHDHSLYRPNELYDNSLLERFDSIDEWENHYFTNIQEYSYEIKEDLFEGKKCVKWFESNCEKTHFYLQDYFYISHKCADSVYIEANEFGFFINYYWPKTKRSKSESSLGDSIIFSLENKELITFIAKDSPIKIGSSLFYRFPISQRDLAKLCSYSIQAVKKTFANGDEPVVFACDLGQVNLFRIWLRKHVQILESLGYKAETEVVEEAPIVEGKCFVYLMLDEANGYYKIGISNKPNYRERTLQSEKPTIKLICAKEYPSRRIAEAIESALHKAYTAEHMRGEWFNLTAKDVQDITQTLA